MRLLETVLVDSENTYARTQSTCSAVRVARRACFFSGLDASLRLQRWGSASQAVG